MAENEPVLPVTSPEDLHKTGHILFVGQTPVLSHILLEFWKQRKRKQVEIGVFDFTPEQQLATTAEGLDDETAAYCIEYHVTSIEVAVGALENLQLALHYRKMTPSAPATWVLLVDGLTPEHWELFRAYLQEGKQARMYVIAATRQSLTSGPLSHAFDIVISYPEN
jgi:hypothetical protein